MDIQMEEKKTVFIRTPILSENKFKKKGKCKSES